MVLIPRSTADHNDVLADFLRDLKDPEEPIATHKRAPPVACCVAALTAMPTQLGANTVIGGVPTFSRSQIRMQFFLRVGRAIDVPKVNVIQYLKNVSVKHNGRAVAPNFGPTNKPWTWQPGADGYRVDQVEDIRCWPEVAGNNGGRNPGQPQPYGLRRNAAARTVTWHDDPGFDTGVLRRELVARAIAPRDFPMTMSAEFKTDILCSDVNPCRRESAAARAALAATWRNSVIASVTWKLDASVDLFRLGGVAVFQPRRAGKPKITRVSIRIDRRC